MDLVSTASNLAGGAINAIAQGDANKKMFAEMQKNRDFNAQQAAIQRDATNPMRQLQMLRLGGMNPAAANASTISQGGTSASAGELGNIQPVTGFGSALQQNELLAAQIDNVKADTKNKETDNAGKEISNGILATEKSFKDAVLNGEIAKVNSSNQRVVFDNEMYQEFNRLFKVDEKGNIFTDSQFESNPALGALYQNYKSIQKSIDVLDSEIEENGAQAALLKIQELFDKQSLGERVRSVKLNNDQTELALKIGDAELSIKRTEGDRLAFQFGQDKKYDDAERIVGMFGEVTDGIADVASAVNGAGVVHAMEKNAKSRQQNADTNAYNSDVNAIEAESRNEHRNSKTIKNYEEFYNYKGVPDNRRNYRSSRSSVPRRHRR